MNWMHATGVSVRNFFHSQKTMHHRFMRRGVYAGMLVLLCAMTPTPTLSVPHVLPCPQGKGMAWRVG